MEGSQADTRANRLQQQSAFPHRWPSVAPGAEYEPVNRRTFRGCAQCGIEDERRTALPDRSRRAIDDFPLALLGSHCDRTARLLAFLVAMCCPFNTSCRFLRRRMPL